MLIRRLTAAAVVLVCVGALGGCSGGGRLTKSEFISSSRAILSWVMNCMAWRSARRQMRPRAGRRSSPWDYERLSWPIATRSREGPYKLERR